MPTYEEVNEVFESLGIMTFNDDVYNFLMWEFAPEDDPSTIEELMYLL